MAGALRALPRARGGGRKLRRRVRDRAQDRRPGHLAGLRGRGAHPRRHPRRRRGGRGRDPEPAHRQGDPAADRRRAAAAGGARRVLPAAQGVRRAQRAPRRRRRAHLRQPAQHGRGLDPPAGHQAHRPAAAVHVELLDRRAGGDRVREPLRVADVAQGARLQGQRRHRAPHRPGRRGQGLPGVGGASASRWTTRSTAWWSRSTTWTCSGAWAWWAASRAGPSPGSSRP